MKVGIISIHSAHNYGSVLQAYALQEEIRKFNNDVEIINYRPNYFEIPYKMFSLKIYSKYKGTINKLMHFIWRTLMIVPRYIKYRKFEKYINTKYNLTKKYSNYKQLEKANFDYDVIFCGSDQIWNTDITDGFDKAYYLGFADDEAVKASYAASLGRKDIDSKYEEEYQKYISRLNYVAIREEESKDVIKRYTTEEVNVTIDPTLLHDIKMWDLLAIKSKLKVSCPYIFVYILEENEEFIKIVNAISEYLKMKVVSISKKKRFNNETIFSNAGPEDFVNLFKNSEFVITNSFHGTAFSLIYQKRNCIIPHQQRGGRMCNLMEKVGLADRIIRCYNELNLNEITKEIDYIPVNEKIEKERQNAEQYIRNVLDYNGKTKK